MTGQLLTGCLEITLRKCPGSEGNAWCLSYATGDVGCPTWKLLLGTSLCSRVVNKLALFPLKKLLFQFFAPWGAVNIAVLRHKPNQCCK